MTPEGRITGAIIRHLKHLRAQAEPIWWHKLTGHPMQTGGDPDLILCYCGQWVLIEVKVPGKKLHPRQAYRHKQIERAAGRILVAETKEAVVDMLEDLKCTWARLNERRSSTGT